MELHHLRSFVAVADAGGVTRAAKRLFMTPPTVSAHVKALEEELNVCLFERTSRGMLLTEKGTLLKQKAEQTLLAAQDLVNHATDMQSYLIGELRIGLNASSQLLRIAEFNRALATVSPGVSLNLFGSATGKIVDDLMQRRLDLGFVFGDVDSAEISTTQLTEVNLQMALPLKIDIIAHNDWHTLAQLPWVCTDYACPFQDVTDSLFAEQGLEITHRVIANDEQTRLDLVKAGVGASLLVVEECRDAVATNEIEVWRGWQGAIALSVACLRSRQQEPMIAAVLKTVCDTWAPEKLG